jgi:ABC-2 type transport system permease protein
MEVYIVLKNNFKRATKSKIKFLLIFLIPTIVITLTILMNTLIKPNFTIGVIDNSKCEESSRIIQLLNKTTGVKLQEANKNSIRTDLIMARYAVVIEFKKSFKMEEINDLNNYVNIYSQKPSLSQDITKLLNYYMYNNTPMELQDFSNELFQEQMSLAQRIMGFIMMCLFITTTMTAAIMIKDKEEGILTRYKYSSNRISHYTMANLIYNFIITYGQLVIAAVIMSILNVHIGISLIVFLEITLLLAFVATAFGTIIGSVFKTEMKANMVSAAIALTTTLFGGGFLPIEKMPKGIKFISYFTPTRWILDFTSAMETGEVFIQRNTALSVLVIFGVICLILSSIINKKKQLV